MSTATTPRITIGLPVYNGCPYLAEALESLAAQTCADIELLISDNASNDGTAGICRAFAARHPYVVYRRNTVNVGVVRNFLTVLERARGKYFMWAAHDDLWDPRYVESLVARLEEHPHAVLAAPNVLHIDADGSLRAESPDRAPAGDRTANLRRFYDDHAPSWLYGVYRTEWLREHVDDVREYPIWGGDVIWLADVLSKFEVVGSPTAFLFKRLRRSAHAPQSARMLLVFWTYMTWYLCRNAWRGSEQLSSRLHRTLLALRYMYRHHLRRPSLLRTAWRFTRTALLAAIETPLWAICRMCTHHAGYPLGHEEAITRSVMSTVSTPA